MDSNRLLIDIFDPKLLSDSIDIVATIQILTQISNPNPIFIKNWSNLIEIGQKWTDFIVFGIVFSINWLLIDFYNLLIDYFNILIELFDLFIDLLINLLIELDRI